MLSVMNFHGNAVPVQKQSSNYINNMMLPDMVQATRLKPLGPDCTISQVEVTDQKILRTVQYYWYISREKGCVECVVKKQGVQENVVASDPRCVITRKHRRFEAYCCMLCRSNFVTIAQALLHFKGIHRGNSKILIQDKDIFHNLEKAMEVPPVPLPWHVAKKVVEQEKPQTDLGPTPTFVIPPGALESSFPITVTSPCPQYVLTNVTNSTPEKPFPSFNSTQEVNSVKESSSTSDHANGSGDNPMVCIITAITNEFKKQVSKMTFGEDYSEVNISFLDGTTLNAKTPDLANSSSDEEYSSIISDNGTDEHLSFSIKYDDDAQSNLDSPAQVTLHANKPALARKMFASSFVEKKKGNMPSTLTKSSVHDMNEKSLPTDSKSAVPEITVMDETEAPVIKQPTNRPVKSVRFMLGAPDSSDDERSATPEQSDHSGEMKNGSKQEKHDGLNSLRDYLLNSRTSKEPDDKDTSLDGLNDVVGNLISTASKGRIPPIPSISPTTPPTVAVTSASARTASIPLVGSSPAISNMIASVNKGKSSSLTRVQSWSPSVSGGTSFSVASMRRPYSARGFTYAEKIELMKQQNDYDAEFVSKHIRRKKTASSNKVTAKQQEGSSSDGDTGVSESMEKFLAKEHQEKKRMLDDGDVESDPDDAAPSMIDIGAMAAAYSNLIQSGLLNTGIFPTEYYGSGEWASAAIKTITSLQSSVLPEETHSNQYKKRHSSHNDTTQPNISVKKEQPEQLADYMNSHKYYSVDNTRESLSDDNTSTISARQQFKANHSASRKRCKSSNESNIVSEDYHYSPSSPLRRKRYKKHNKVEATGDDSSLHDSDPYSDSSDSAFAIPSAVKPGSPDQTKANHSDGAIAHKSMKQRYMPNSLDKVSLQSSKVSVSPLISASDNGSHSILQKTKTSNTSTSALSLPMSSESLQNPLVSRLSSKTLGSKCSSDPALSSSSSSNKSLTASPIPSVPNLRLYEVPKSVSNKTTVPTTYTDDTKVAHFLNAGDHLILFNSVSLADFEKNEVVSTRLKGAQTNCNSTENAKNMMNMPEMFRNCIETHIKIQCVQKVHVCKVCGFSVDTASKKDHGDSSGVDKTLQSHVMEHSLKELYAIGYDVGNW